MERTTLEIIAPSVDEAINRGVSQLGVNRDMVDVEILDEGTRGFLGLGSRQVRVRLTLKSAGKENDELKPPASSPVASMKTTQDDSDDELLNFTEQTTHELITKMKVSARIDVRYGEADEQGDVPVLVDIHGNDLSILIGRRAETLNALQYILSLIVSKEAGRWVQIMVDVEGYRNRRERQLRQLAHRMADQALRTGKRQVLEPMSPADRRIIHLELRESADVETESIGEEPNRKVTIVPKK